MKFKNSLSSLIKSIGHITIGMIGRSACTIKEFKILPLRNWVYIILGSIINTLVLYQISLFLIDQVVYYADDSTEIVQVSSLIDTLFFESHPPPGKDNVIFINSSYDNVLVDHYDELTGSGNRTITDRNKLLGLFKTLNKESINYKYILCDIAFQDKTPFDSALATEMEKMRIVIPSSLDENNNILFPNESFRDINTGTSEYAASEGLFVKFKYVDGNNKSIPVKMYEDIHGKKFTVDNGVYKRDGKTVLNNPVLNFRLNHYDIFVDKKYHIMNIGNLLTLPTSIIQQYLSNKIVVIGDFVSNDIHDTVVGDMSGPLILLNAYYALAQGDNIITWKFHLFLVVSYFILSLLILLPPKLLSKIIFIKKKESLDKFIKEKFFTSMFSLLFISIASYLFFGVHVNILYVLFYMIALQFAVRMYYKRNPV